jgi:hypothetical protein
MIDNKNHPQEAWEETQEVRCDMASVEVGLNLTELVREYNICCEVWPEYLSVDGEHRQVGFELELLGSHSLDPNHLDPACPMCKRVRAALREIAGSIVPSGNSVTYEIDAHSESLICEPRLGHRPFVIVSIRILHRQGFDQPIAPCVIACLKQIIAHLEELGVRER